MSVTYDGSQIGVLSDSGTVTLQTEGRVVEHDIEVEYTNPNAANFNLTVINNTNDTIHIETSPVCVILDNPHALNGIEYVVVQGGQTVFKCLSPFVSTENYYRVAFSVNDKDEEYTITSNNPLFTVSRVNDYIHAIAENAAPFTDVTLTISFAE